MIIENSHRLYEITLPLVGIQNLVMGITMSIISLSKKHKRLYNRTGLIFLSIAMLVLFVVNIAEYIVGVQVEMMKNSLAIVVFTASIELFLCFFTYISLLDKSVVTRNRIAVEIALIALFTTPPLFIENTNSKLFQWLFGVALTFYVVKLIANFIVYRKYLRRAISIIENYHSNESSSLISWINRTFYVTITVGLVSVFAPMGDYRGLIVYNLFMFIAFFYIYIEVISNIYVFDGSMAVIEQPSSNNSANRLPDDVDSELQQSANKEQVSNFMNRHRRAVYQQWIDQKGYTDPTITVDNIATILNTNRNKLSAYLNNELGMNYYEWIAHLRIEEAKKLLIEEFNIPICNIAVRVGIEDKSNFGRAFRRMTGMSPTTYRNKNIANTK